MRIKVTLQLKPFIEAKAKAKEAERKSTSTISSKSPAKIDTRKELAATAGVSEDSFRKAEAVLKSDKLKSSR